MFSNPPIQHNGSGNEPPADDEDPDVHWELALEHRRRLRHRRRERILQRLGSGGAAGDSEDREKAEL